MSGHVFELHTPVLELGLRGATHALRVLSSSVIQSAQHDHEIVVRGISLQKPSVHDSGRLQCEGEVWSRLTTAPSMLLNFIEIAIFLDTGDRLGEVYRWSEGLAGKLRLGARQSGYR